MYTEINALCKFHSNNIINIILLRERKKHIHNVSLKKKIYSVCFSFLYLQHGSILKDMLFVTHHAVLVERGDPLL